MESKTKFGLFILIAIGILILIVFILRKTKRFKLPNVVIVTGAPKTGKSALCLVLARRCYRLNLIKWYIGKPIFKIVNHFAIHKREYPLKPMFYSNIPLD